MRFGGRKFLIKKTGNRKCKGGVGVGALAEARQPLNCIALFSGCHSSQIKIK